MRVLIGRRAPVDRPARARGRNTIEFTIETRRKGEWAVVHVQGEIDAHTAPRLRERIRQLLDGGELRLVVDADGVEFMDSAALGVLVNGFKQATSGGGTIALVCTRPNITRLLNITGLDAMFPPFASVDEVVGR
jgi:anti-sigma B factor antagonist